jgi:hypothetical protein
MSQITHVGIRFHNWPAGLNHIPLRDAIRSLQDSDEAKRCGIGRYVGLEKDSSPSALWISLRFEFTGTDVAESLRFLRAQIGPYRSNLHNGNLDIDGGTAHTLQVAPGVHLEELQYMFIKLPQPTPNDEPQSPKTDSTGAVTVFRENTLLRWLGPSMLCLIAMCSWIFAEASDPVTLGMAVTILALCIFVGSFDLGIRKRIGLMLCIVSIFGSIRLAEINFSEVEIFGWSISVSWLPGVCSLIAVLGLSVVLGVCFAVKIASPGRQPPQSWPNEWKTTMLFGAILFSGIIYWIGRVEWFPWHFATRSDYDFGIGGLMQLRWLVTIGISGWVLWQIAREWREIYDIIQVSRDPQLSRFTVRMKERSFVLVILIGPYIARFFIVVASQTAIAIHGVSRRVLYRLFSAKKLQAVGFATLCLILVTLMLVATRHFGEELTSAFQYGPNLGLILATLLLTGVLVPGLTGIGLTLIPERRWDLRWSLWSSFWFFLAWWLASFGQPFKHTWEDAFYVGSAVLATLIGAFLACYLLWWLGSGRPCLSEPDGKLRTPNTKTTEPSA